MYYHIHTGLVTRSRPRPLIVNSVAYTHPTDKQYNQQGILPLTRFVAPEGYVKRPDTRSIDHDAETAWELYEVETLKDYQQRHIEAQEAQMIAKALGLPKRLTEAYSTFRDAYESAIAAAMMAGAEDVDVTISYQSLLAALSRLNNDEATRDLANWLELAFTLKGLWDVVEVQSGGTAAQAYAMLPLLEMRYQIDLEAADDEESEDPV